MANVLVPHILVVKGDFIQDISLNPALSPPYEQFTSWLLPTQEGAQGIVWKNGFLVCGGRVHNITEKRTNDCKHMVIGDSVAKNYPLMPGRFSRSAATTVNGKMWITGGLNFENDGTNNGHLEVLVCE